MDPPPPDFKLGGTWDLGPGTGAKKRFLSGNTVLAGEGDVGAGGVESYKTVTGKPMTLMRWARQHMLREPT